LLFNFFFFNISKYLLNINYNILNDFITKITNQKIK